MKISEGIFAIYKPKGPTSNGILRKIKKLTGIEKVGHAGTLDPLACGVLVVGVGREATKQLGKIVEKDKEYITKIRLGAESATDDAEGEIREFEVTKKPTLKKIKTIIQEFKGKIEQTPPVYSAVKVAGQEAYKRARRGEKFVIKPRLVEIKDIKIISYQWPYLKLKVLTGPGVYIRSLARDIGKRLTVGGYVVDLERTRVGNFSKNLAIDI